MQTIRVTVVLVGGGLAVLLLGRIPINNDFRATTNGILVRRNSNAELVLRIRKETFDWRQYLAKSHFLGDIAQHSHVTIGRGDRGFLLETPVWSVRRPDATANAL